MVNISLDTSTEQLLLMASTALTIALENGSLNKNEEHLIKHHLCEIVRHTAPFIDEEELTNRILSDKLTSQPTDQ